MLPLEEAQSRLLALAPRLRTENVDVASALGRYLLEPLKARRTQPAAHVSAMDGYAVTGPDLAGPWTVIGESAAGHPFAGSIEPGQAVRISTGALMPAGADAVILQEDIVRAGERIELTGTPPSPPGKHIRRCGSDFALDHELLPAGARIGPAQLALAIAAGHKHLPVRRVPHVVIIDSGDELAEDPELCPAHQVPASNGAMIAALLAANPCTVSRIGPVRDDLEALARAFHDARDADVVVTTGGASVGDHDLIRPAIEQAGGTLDFWKVAIKPGKPLLVATRGAQVILGLPGNPVSSHVTAFLFLLPLLRASLGAGQPLPCPIPLPLASAMQPGGDRREFLRGRLSDGGVEVLTQQDSGALAAMAAAQVLIDRPAGSPARHAGEKVDVHFLGNGGIA
ncbi:molybdopterin molybdotransferase MoeA [Novosphingobium sp. TH158]|uniref:molybdopterin molybdotransferase MoeA n=1 Tax=Novosphingobium sp. TH158 TaxID=2067455 RepID=UPI000C7D1111|nr:molybdopterin molybdotransferase MoeA [Novosphingobium sp. TH158]PLK27746.1 molybdopterin molybdenumtransferase MoeA [Novosphingobium sp. TH158]